MQSCEKCSSEFLTQSLHGSLTVTVRVAAMISAVAFYTVMGWYHPQDGAARKIYYV
jgi:hypothetical protein